MTFGPLVVVAGKGGVGRSSVTAAIALNARSEGKRVLAVDAVGDGGLQAVFDRSAAADGGGNSSGGELEVLCLTPDRALKEYLRIFLRVPIPSKRIAPMSKLFDYVATAAPGVREILVLGKIATEVRDGDWDLVVVDGPATGHVVELLHAADTLSDLIRVGPIVSQTRWIGELVADPDVTSVVAVTLPEELPVTECIELLDRLGNEARIRVAGVISNRTPTVLTQAALDEASALGTDIAQLARRRSVTVDAQLDRLDDLDLPLLCVPPARAGIDPVIQLQAALADWP